MQADLAPSAAFTFLEEGGYSDDRADDGNWSSGRAGEGAFVGSMYGVSAPELIRWYGRAVTAAEMRSLPQAIAQAIFSARYWQTLRCDDLPAGPDLLLADMGYNAGDATSARLLQQRLGFVGADLDGWIGDQTVAAVGAVTTRKAGAWAAKLQPASARALQATLGVSADGEIGPRTLAALAANAAGPTLALCCALADEQALHYRGLAGFARYGAGWLGRVDRRLAAGLRLVVVDPASAPQPNGADPAN